MKLAADPRRVRAVGAGEDRAAPEPAERIKSMSMSPFRFLIAVAVTSLALVAVLVVSGGLLARNAFASSPWFGRPAGAWFGGPGGPWFAGPGGPWSGAHAFGYGFDLPPELAGLRDVPAAERFNHFLGVRVSLRDRDNRPVTVDVTPGTVTAVSATSLTVAGNDGAAKTFTLDDKTAIRGKTAASGTPSSRSTVAQSDRVVVITLNSSTRATAVMIVSPEGFGWRGPFGH